MPRIRHCKTRRQQIDTITYQTLIDSSVKTTIAFPTTTTFIKLGSGRVGDGDSFCDGPLVSAKCSDGSKINFGLDAVIILGMSTMELIATFYCFAVVSLSMSGA